MGLGNGGLAKSIHLKKGMPDFFYYIEYKADIAKF